MAISASISLVPGRYDHLYISKITGIVTKSYNGRKYIFLETKPIPRTSGGLGKIIEVEPGDLVMIEWIEGSRKHVKRHVIGLFRAKKGARKQVELIGIEDDSSNPSVSVEFEVENLEPVADAGELLENDNIKREMIEKGLTIPRKPVSAAKSLLAFYIMEHGLLSTRKEMGSKEAEKPGAEFNPEAWYTVSAIHVKRLSDKEKVATMLTRAVETGLARIEDGKILVKGKLLNDIARIARISASIVINA